MTTIQILNVSSMNESQLMSFAANKFPEYYDDYYGEPSGRCIKTEDDIIHWLEMFVDQEPRTDFGLKALQASIEVEFSVRYCFEGDVYVPYLDIYTQEEEEEVTTAFEAQNLPLLGGCLVYQTLSRIVYQGGNNNQYWDKLDLLSNFIRMCGKKRITFADYRRMLLVEQLKIAEMLLRLDK
jgi:hypothetical protein